MTVAEAEAARRPPVAPVWEAALPTHEAEPALTAADSVDADDNADPAALPGEPATLGSAADRAAAAPPAVATLLPVSQDILPGAPPPIAVPVVAVLRVVAAPRAPAASLELLDWFDDAPAAPVPPSAAPVLSAAPVPSAAPAPDPVSVAAPSVLSAAAPAPPAAASLTAYDVLPEVPSGFAETAGAPTAAQFEPPLPPTTAVSLTPTPAPSSEPAPPFVPGSSHVPSQPVGSSYETATLAGLAEQMAEPVRSPQAAGVIPGPRVELGFRDGSHTRLDPAGEQAQALEELARTLTGF